MSRRRLASASLFISTILALVLGSLAPTQAMDGDLPTQPVHVTVLDDETGDPLAGIGLTLYIWLGDSWVDSGHHFTSDADGKVEFGFSTASEADLVFGFTDPSDEHSTVYGDGSLSDLPEGPDGPGAFHYGVDPSPHEMTVRLPRAEHPEPTYDVTGYVASPEGDYLDDVSVEAYDVDAPDADPVASDITYEGSKHGHGFYRLHLPDGDYRVTFSPMDSDAYASVDYPETVHVSGGAVTLDDVRLPLASQPVARGTVTSADGVIPGASVVAFRWDELDERWYQYEGVTGDEDGAFAVPVPRDATVTFKFSKKGYETLVLGGGSALPVTPDSENSRDVGDDDIDLHSVQLEPRGTDLGRVAGQALPYCTTNTLPANDDDSSEAVDIPFPLTFFGQPYTRLYVNNNGNVTFNEPLSRYTPSSLEGDTGLPIIAPFFADVDTEADGSAEVTYGTSSDGHSLCVNWADVGYYGTHDDKLNTFQLILTENGVGEGRVEGDFDITFNYDSIQWETGDASDGEGGFGGDSAAAGFSAGTGDAGTWVQLPGSFVNGALLDGGPQALISAFQGSVQPGRYVFQVRNSGIELTLGNLTGTVVTTSAAPVAGAYVQACRRAEEGEGAYCRTTVTDDAGAYTFTGLKVGSYDINVSPKTGSPLFPGFGVGSVTAGEDAVAEPIELQAPQPLPNNVSLSNHDRDSGLMEPYSVPGQVPVIHYMAAIDFAFDGCAGTASPTYTQRVGGVVHRTAPLTESPANSGHYSATIPSTFPLHGDGSITTNVPASCDDGAAPVGFDVYIDPSGVVTDQYGRPLVGAGVELQRADAANGPFVMVPDNSPVMSPANRTNPDTTGAGGFFQWDVLTGWYQVKASHAGCTDATTDPMEVPPARLDLLIKMTCAAVAMPTPGTAPVLTGTPQVGQQLTVSQGSWGPILAFEKVEWLRGATVVGTGPSYTVRLADQGSPITARVYAKRPDYTQENGVGGVVSFASATYDVTSGVVPVTPGGGGGGQAAPTNTAAPTITGVPKVGQTLTAHPGTWSVSDLTYSYQWQRAGQPITGATAADYTATAADLGKELTVAVKATKPGLPDGSASSAPVTVTIGDAPVALAPPVVTGEAVRGEQLRVTPGTWNVADLSFAYQWLRDGTPISGATASAHTVSASDQGAALSVVVTARRSGYQDGTATSAPVSVPVPPQPGTLESVTTATLVRDVVRAGQRARLRIEISLEDGSPLAGPYEVKIDGVTALSRRLTADDRGRDTVSLPKLSPGKHLVRVAYLGGRTAGPSRSEVARLTVKPRPAHGHHARGVLHGRALLPWSY